MKHLIIILLITLNIFNANSQTVEENFNGACPTPAHAFYMGCVDNWIAVSGTPSLAKAGDECILPLDRNYADTYSAWEGFHCSPGVSIAETYALNYEFQAGNCYSIEFSLATTGLHPAIRQKTQWVLTSNRPNVNMMGINHIHSCEATPELLDTDEVVWSKDTPNRCQEWQTYRIEFRPTHDHNQLWFRSENEVASWSSERFSAISRIFVDNFSLEGVDNNPNFNLQASGNTATGQVSVTATATNTAPYAKHWWDVFYAPNGSTVTNNEVPDNPYQCCNSTTATFSNNLYINTWYYIKHGVFTDNCGNWRELRKPFRVQLKKSIGSQSGYEIIYGKTFEVTDSEMPDNIEENLLTSYDEVKSTKPSTTETNIYPNPASSVLFINPAFQNSESDILVLDMTGRVMYKSNISGNTSIDLQDFSNGTYIMHITNKLESLNEVRKFTIQK